MTPRNCLRAMLVVMDLAERLAAALAVTEVVELVGGHQSRVFRVRSGDGASLVVKLLDAARVDRAALDARLDVTAALADLDDRVCRPRLLGGRRVTELTASDGRTHHVVCFEFASGTPPDPADPADAAAMGVALAQLHGSMRRLPAAALPVVHALRTVPDDPAAVGAHQLLHGDFGADNLRIAGGVMRIFDFDDCGYGPPAFDVANALYRVLFDSVTTVTTGATGTYERFRANFVDGYVGASGAPLPDEVLDAFIGLRVRALGAWLDDLDGAPIGIRDASPAWHATLRTFVAGQSRA